MPGIELDSLSDELSYLTSSINLDLSETQSQPQSQSQTNPVVKDSTSDDLIPSDDPCYHNLKLRNLSVELLQRLTSKTILSFILSLLDGDQVVHHQSTATQNSFSIDDHTRHSIIRSVQNNRESFARQSRAEAQLIIGQYLLETRSKILEDFENESNSTNQTSNGQVSTDNPDDHQDVDDQDQSSSPSINPLSERLNEKFVSKIVQEKLETLIKNDYLNHVHEISSSSINNQSGQSDSRCVKICTVCLLDCSDLISFSALVYSWNKLFNLILSSTITSSSSSSSSSDLP
ncbi:hypothetical protein MJO28_016562 [Puccinia striiformis f. sp. tritici]|uniref:Uncharacterized protein n=1 Tax=Puccinia striiformis f. sp. tritici TaxID=168172 RepID=A0ACC0DPB5_9BASI|nr:hypothetical protein Pst134EA_030357 [Puccinia striiformis f. sp. tritici]KAH9446437.1 hypothetical protein Pst134EA_030357 [Puccinia striiformis f. sp. tritici]KAI7934812.1 hypothetical protein MJO29_016075 [Puccinia striiformis f. sp. tritici]KAI7935691.1 hypothetical protein MJO28_016562 [Puccinia striiformis f. sp. tritici]